jgi:hypothetical protein
MLGLTGALTYWARESLMKTAVNRRLMATVAVMFAIEALFGIVFERLEVSHATQEVVHIVVAVLITGTLAIYSERWMALPAIGYAIALLACGISIEARFLAFGLGNLLLTITLVVVWRPRGGYRGRRGRT